ncbi:beta-lactamase [Xylariaceae sp. FL1272]|nr:beta-lactamase [Xylariaceae sp. FL1272]
MSTFSSALADSARAGHIPGAVVCAKSIDGSIDWRQAFSAQTWDFEADSVIELASLTKLVTTIAALQLVEQGRLSLSHRVEDLIPAFANLKVLDGFDSHGLPLTHTRRNPVTLEHLLMHTSGAAYTVTDEQTAQYANWRGESAHWDGTVDSSFDLPLAFEPGESWCYGPGIDRLGQVIESVTGESLETYFHQNIFKPLNITTGSFWNKPDVAMAFRKEDGSIRPDPTASTFTTGLTKCHGGQSLVMSIPDFAKILDSLLVDDEKVLKCETTALLFEPRLSSQCKEALIDRIQGAHWTVGDIPATGEYSWGPGGLLVDGDSHPFRRRKYLSWSGATNNYWFIDRSAGIYGVFGTGILPSNDPFILRLLRKFEEEVYLKVDNP